MQLNHLNLAVPDLAAATDFFEKGFDFRVVNRFEGMRVLAGDDGFALALTECAQPDYPESFHIGFLQASRDAVSDVHQRLLAAGIEVPVPPADAYGAFIFTCSVPGGIEVEIAYRPG